MGKLTTLSEIRRYEARERTLRDARNSRRASPEGRRAEAAAGRFKAYGLTAEQYDALVLASTGRCALCARPDDDGRHSLVVDHSHASARVRGLLCNPCNRTVGLIETYGLDVAWMTAALALISAHHQHIAPCAELSGSQVCVK